MSPGVLTSKFGKMVRTFMKRERGQTDYGKDEEWKEPKKSEWPRPESLWFTGCSPVEI